MNIMRPMTAVTVAEFIEALGGTSFVAAEIGTVPSAVSNWKTLGRLPDSARIHRELARLARAKIPEPVPLPAFVIIAPQASTA